jgi:homoserine kinase
MQDSLHQTSRATLIPGLAEILRMPRAPGLLGIALSGSGPSVIALATDHFEDIGKAIAQQFARHQLSSTIQCLTVSQSGLTAGHL